MRYKYGFTLLEILVVITVVGILSAIVAVNLRVPSAQLMGNDLQALFYQAKLESVKRNRPVAIMWNAASQTFTVQYSPSSNNSASACTSTTILQSKSAQEYRNLTLTPTISGNGLVWLPSGLVTTCGGSPQAASIGISDGHITKTLSISIIGRISL